MIQIEITDNGYITIDATDADAREIGYVPYSPGADARVRQIAAAIAGHDNIRRMSLRHKRGLTNNGFEAVFIDQTKQDRYIRKHQ